MIGMLTDLIHLTHVTAEKVTIDKRINDYLTTIEEAVNSGAAFIASEAPAVVVELVMYHRCVSTLAVSAAVLSATILYRLLRTTSDEETVAIIGVFGGSLSLLSFVMTVPYAAKAWLAPRVLILEEIAKLL